MTTRRAGPADFITRLSLASSLILLVFCCAVHVRTLLGFDLANIGPGPAEGFAPGAGWLLALLVPGLALSLTAMYVLQVVFSDDEADRMQEALPWWLAFPRGIYKRNSVALYALWKSAPWVNVVNWMLFVYSIALLFRAPHNPSGSALESYSLLLFSGWSIGAFWSSVIFFSFALNRIEGSPSGPSAA